MNAWQDISANDALINWVLVNSNISAISVMNCTAFKIGQVISCYHWQTPWTLGPRL